MTSFAPACDPLSRAHILSEALPYIQQFQGRIFVIKYGGAAMVHEARRAEVLSDIV
ncbi:MAG: acetylglutamate kinase, partial [Cyanobacteria bacterium J06648_11]